MSEFTVDEISDVVKTMRSRLESAQGGLHSAMCRLSLPMSEFLLAALESALAGEAAALEEVARLRESLEWCVKDIERLQKFVTVEPVYDR